MSFWSDKPLPRYYGKPFREKGIGYLCDIRHNRLPSVTSIIEATKLPQEKARFARWRKSKGTEASQIITTACQRGKLIHRQIESYLRDENFVCPYSIRDYWEPLKPVLDRLHDVRLLEGYAFHYYEGYAGRVDAVAKFHNIPCVVEFQSTSSIKPVDTNKVLQLAAHCGALNRQYGKKYGVEINHALLIVATPGETVVTLFEPNEVMEYWNKWLQCVARFWNQKREPARVTQPNL